MDFPLLQPDPGVNGIDHHVDDAERQKSEPMDTVFVRQVAPSGPADRAGLSTGTVQQELQMVVWWLNNCQNPTPTPPPTSFHAGV